MAVVIVLITLVMDILIGGGALRPVHIKVLVLLIVLVVVFGHGDDHAAAYRDGGHADLYSVSDYIGCGRALRPVHIKVLVMLIVLVVVFGHGQLAMLLLIDTVDMLIFIVFLITLVVAER